MAGCLQGVAMAFHPDVITVFKSVDAISLVMFLDYHCDSHSDADATCLSIMLCYKNIWLHHRFREL